MKFQLFDWVLNQLKNDKKNTKTLSWIYWMLLQHSLTINHLSKNESCVTSFINNFGDDKWNYVAHSQIPGLRKLILYFANFLTRQKWQKKNTP